MLSELRYQGVKWLSWSANLRTTRGRRLMKAVACERIGEAWTRVSGVPDVATNIIFSCFLTIPTFLSTSPCRWAAYRTGLLRSIRCPRFPASWLRRTSLLSDSSTPPKIVQAAVIFLAASKVRCVGRPVSAHRVLRAMRTLSAE